MRRGHTLTRRRKLQYANSTRGERNRIHHRRERDSRSGSSIAAPDRDTEDRSGSWMAYRSRRIAGRMGAGGQMWSDPRLETINTVSPARAVRFRWACGAISYPCHHTIRPWSDCDDEEKLKLSVQRSTPPPHAGWRAARPACVFSESFDAVKPRPRP